MNEISQIGQAKKAALDILLHNARGPHGLPRTAGWGYPEPYTRDLMIASLGILTSGNEMLTASLKNTLQSLAENQSPRGHIPSLAHDPEDRGASDTTPLFLFAAALYREKTGDRLFLEEAVQKALVWMDYQSPSDRTMVGQLPTTDWRDEQWVLGFGLYVNTLVYAYLQLLGWSRKAQALLRLMDRFTIKGDHQNRHVHEGLVLRHKPYYAAWSYKIYKNERVDILGNSLAVLTGIASPSRARHIVAWVEQECDALREKGLLYGELPPNLFPYVLPDDPDWHPRYEKHNLPGEYHNGGIWPFVCGFHIAAIVAAGRLRLAEEKLFALTGLVCKSRRRGLAFGFNEWHRAQDGTPQGQDWQTWSAAMYLYAAAAVEQQSTPFFDIIRQHGHAEI